MPEIDLGPIIGPQGPQGATGPAGAAGPGVPAGGTAGQIVTKKSSTGFDTEWRSPVNDANQTEAGYVLDARMGKTLNDLFIYTDGSYTFSSQEALNTLIETLATGNGSYKETKYKLTCGATFGLFTNGYVYCADITRGGSTYYINVEMTPIDDGTIKIVGNKRNTTWSWDRIAKDSEMFRETIADNSNFNSYTIAAGGKDRHFTGTNVGSISNRPSDIASTYAYAFNLDAESINGYTVQTLTIYGSSVQVYRRQQYYYQGNQWTNWEKFALLSNVANRPIYDMRVIESGHKIEISEISAQRFAIIISHDGGMFLYDRWAGICTIHETSRISITTTGQTNTLGKLTITNLHQTYYAQIFIIADPNWIGSISYV